EEDIDTPDDSTDTVDEDGDVPSNPTKKKTSTTVVDDKVPSTLPKTGAIGVFASENGVNVLWVLVPVAILVAAAFAYARKREK
ncbi:MAG: LPXTG cell wall anchor domain-containing protein, partial [Lachnospiraceae bacterium]|nr:LPXTG cell wall anchor domain-containing protein [Lachnospiraceae bacterium]